MSKSSEVTIEVPALSVTQTSGRLTKALKEWLLPWVVTTVSLVFFLLATTLVHTVLTKALPFFDPERLVAVGHLHAERGEMFGAFSPDDVSDLRIRVSTLSSLSAYYYWSGHTVGALRSDDGAKQVSLTYVDPQFFPTLGVDPQAGTILLEGDPTQIVLSHEAWQRHFGGADSIVGKTIVIDDQSLLVRGVMPRSFGFPDAAVDGWLPLANIKEADVPWRRDVRWLDVVARLRPEALLDAARADFDAVTGALASEYPESNRHLARGLMLPLTSYLAGDGAGLPALALCALALLLVAAINVSSILLAIYETRKRELAIRAAHGAPFSAQLFAFAKTPLAVFALSLIASLMAASYLVTRIGPALASTYPRMSEIGVDGVFIGAAIMATVVVAVIALAPAALRLRRLQLAQELIGGGVAGASQTIRSRNLLLVAQIMVVGALLYGTATVTLGLQRQANADVGVRYGEVGAWSMQLRGARYAGDDALIAGRHALIEAVRDVPGVEGVAASKTPVFGETGERYGMKLASGDSEWVNPEWGFFFVTDDYFAALGAPLVLGESFKDGSAGDVPAVVNRSFAERWFPGRSPIGQRIQTGLGAFVTITGVVADVLHLGPSTPPKPAVYVPMDRFGRSSLNLLVGSRGGADQDAQIHSALVGLDGDLAVERRGTLNETRDELFAAERLLARAMSVFAAMSAGVAGFGIYALVHYLIVLRRRELSLRVALGAQPAALRRLLAVSFARLAGLGFVLSIPLAGGLGWILSRQFEIVAPWQPTAALIAAAALTGAILLAVTPGLVWVSLLGTEYLARADASIPTTGKQRD